MEEKKRAWRPFWSYKYTPEELLKNLKSYPWKEKDLCDFIEERIKDFCLEVLWEKYISHQREWQFTFHKRFAWNKSAIDFIIATENWNILIEVKNPKNYSLHDLTSGLWQSLNYYNKAKVNWYDIYRNIILTTKTNLEVISTIQNLNLPIEMIILQSWHFLYENKH